VVREFEVVKEGLLQRQLDAINDTDEVWGVIDQIPEEAIPPETRRRLFRHEVARFQRWAAARTSRGGEWETEYEAWGALRRATERVLELPELHDQDELLYVLARDNECELVLENLLEHPEHGMRLARAGVGCGDHEARWQLAVFLRKQSTQEAGELLERYKNDDHEYVRRSASGANLSLDP
jgi:hypothetical protein